MLVTDSNETSMPLEHPRPPSILDSPTLARVERARLRLEAASSQQHHHHQQQQQQHMQFYGTSSGVGVGGGGGGSSSGSASNATTMNREDSLERSILDPKKDVPWHQVWTHMKRLSHASKVNSSSTLTAHRTDTSTYGGSGHNSNCAAYLAERTASLKDNLFQQVQYRPEMQSLLAGRIPVASMTGPIKRGLLWQQRDRLFSRWKERYFVLTRDYLHCFKRASGSANERASDMGQFIFKVKLVDVEKVEWLNRRSYSAIGLLLGREGRVLLRCDDGLEDWFELLEECTLTSKERRRALKIAQGPRSRASLAAPVSHAALQTHHFGLGGTYSSALDDWLMANGSGARHRIAAGSLGGGTGHNPFLFSDSVPDLSILNNENHSQHRSGLSTNHSTPQKIPYASAGGANLNASRYSNGYASQNSSMSNGLYGSPRRIFINSSFGSSHVVDEEEAEDGEVQLRRPHLYRNNNNNINNNINSSTENGNELDHDWLYRKPRPPTEMRHSVQAMLPVSSPNQRNSPSSKQKVASGANRNAAELDQSAHDSGLDTPPSTHRPSSYRDSSETTASSSRGTLLNSPGGSFRAKHLNHVANLNQVNALHGSRYSVQERSGVLKVRNEEEPRCAAIKVGGDAYNDPNQNRCYSKNGNQSPAHTPQHTPHKLKGAASASNNNGGTLNGNTKQSVGANGAAAVRYQHPALTAIINEAQGMKFRDRSYSDCQQLAPRRPTNNNNNNHHHHHHHPSSPLTPRRSNAAHFGTPTRV